MSLARLPDTPWLQSPVASAMATALWVALAEVQAGPAPPTSLCPVSFSLVSSRLSHSWNTFSTWAPVSSRQWFVLLVNITSRFSQRSALSKCGFQSPCLSGPCNMPTDLWVLPYPHCHMPGHYMCASSVLVRQDVATQYSMLLHCMWMEKQFTVFWLKVLPGPKYAT